MSEENASQSHNEDANASQENDGVQYSEDKQGSEKSVEDVFYGENKDQDADNQDAAGSDDNESNNDDESSKENEEYNKDNEKSGDDKNQDAKGDDDKDYSVDVPENSRLSEADRERIESYAKDQGLSKEAAQKLVEQESQARDEYFEGLQTQHKEMVGKWAESIKTDKELGGENYAKNIELAKRVAHKFGTEKFLHDLDASGYGNHPEVVRVFARIGRAMSNDELVRSGSQAGGDRSMEDIFYGSKQN